MKYLGRSFGLIAIIILLMSMAEVVSAVTWPRQRGVYIAKSSALIPAFPKVLSEFRFAGKNKDYWDETFETFGKTRVFSGNGWEALNEFPHTMNNCGAGVFMLRWRSENRDVRVSTAIAYDTNTISVSKNGTFGYIYGTNCEQPFFKFESVTRGNESTLVDIYYEIKFWQAAP